MFASRNTSSMIEPSAEEKARASQLCQEVDAEIKLLLNMETNSVKNYQQKRDEILKKLTHESVQRDWRVLPLKIHTELAFSKKLAGFPEAVTRLRYSQSHWNQRDDQLRALQENIEAPLEIRCLAKLTRAEVLFHCFPHPEIETELFVLAQTYCLELLTVIADLAENRTPLMKKMLLRIDILSRLYYFTEAADNIANAIVLPSGNWRSRSVSWGQHTIPLASPVTSPDRKKSVESTTAPVTPETLVPGNSSAQFQSKKEISVTHIASTNTL